MEQQVAAHLKQTILQEQREILVNNLMADRHMDFLRSRYILSEDDCEEINTQTTRKKRASKFLDILLTKGPRAYDMLLRALELEGTQTFLREILNRDFEARIQNYHALVNPQQNQPVIKIIPPPAVRPPPPKQLHSGGGSSLEPVEHHYKGDITPPSSPDFLKSCLSSSSSASTISISSEPTAFTDLSSQLGESLPRQETSRPGDGGRIIVNNNGRMSPRLVNTVDILQSICSSGSGPVSFCSNQAQQSYSLTSSFPSSSSASSSPSIISGISESASSKLFRNGRLSSRGGSEDQDDVSLPSPTVEEPTSLPSGPSPQCVAGESGLGDGAALPSILENVQSPSSEGTESGGFFGSLPQSWVDTSLDYGSLNCQECSEGQITGLAPLKGHHQHSGEANGREKNICCKDERSSGSDRDVDHASSRNDCYAHNQSVHPEVSFRKGEVPGGSDVTSKSGSQNQVKDLQFVAADSGGVNLAGSRTSSHC